MSAGPEPELQLEMPEVGAAFSIDNHIWDAVSLIVEVEPEVPPGYPLSDLAGRCLQRFSAVVKRHASSRQTTPSSSPAIGAGTRQQEIRLSVPLEIAIDLRYEKGRLENWCTLARENDMMICRTDFGDDVSILIGFPQLPDIVASLLTLYTQLGILAKMPVVSSGTGMQQDSLYYNFRCSPATVVGMESSETNFYVNKIWAELTPLLVREPEISTRLDPEVIWMSTIQDDIPNAVENVSQMIDCLWSFKTALSMRSLATKGLLQGETVGTFGPKELSTRPVTPVPVIAVQQAVASKNQTDSPSVTARGGKGSDVPVQRAVSRKAKPLIPSAEISKIDNRVVEPLFRPPKCKIGSDEKKCTTLRRKLVFVGDGVSFIFLKALIPTSYVL
jgi:hypothetical protein